jgi:hypothetical protein
VKMGVKWNWHKIVFSSVVEPSSLLLCSRLLLLVEIFVYVTFVRGIFL